MPLCFFLSSDPPALILTAKKKAIEQGLGPKEHKKKKKKKQDKALPVPAESAVEATKKMFAQKKFSKKINYDVLEGEIPPPSSC